MAEQAKTQSSGHVDQEVLRYWREFFQSVMEALPEGVVIVNIATYIVTVNKGFENILGVSRRKAETRPLKSVLPKEFFDQGDISGKVAKIFAGESPPEAFEVQVVIGEARKVLEVNLKPGSTSQDEESATPIVVIVLKDVTRERDLQQQLFQSEKMASIGTVASGMAHELNTPLGSIAFNIEILERYLKEDKYRKLLNSMMKSANRCKDITGALLSYVRPTQVGTAQEKIFLKDVVTSSLEMTQKLLGTEGIEIVQELDDAAAVYGNGNELSQILINFLTNAQDSIAQSGEKKIIIRVYTREEKAILEVEDSGEGISEKDKQRLFEPFFTTKPVGKGTGLGLTVSKGIADKHAASIEVKSSNSNGGAIFSLVLPWDKS